jgi:hypothetical protein
MTKKKGFTVATKGDDIFISLGDNTALKKRRLQIWVKRRGKDEWVPNPKLKELYPLLYQPPKETDES